MNKSLLIIGAGGHAVSIANVATAADFKITAFVDDNKAGSDLIGIPIIKQEECESKFADGNYVIAIGDNAVRERVYKELSKRLPKVKFPSMVHPSAVVSFKTTISEGTVVMPNVTVGPNSNVGMFCILNTNSSIDHDCSMADFSSIAPGVTIGGKVEIGMSSAISIGATIKQGVTIAEDVVVGASSYVNKNMPSQVVCYGIPCKAIRSRKKGDSYLV